jgi:hypothetical protein
VQWRGYDYKASASMFKKDGEDRIYGDIWSTKHTQTITNDNKENRLVTTSSVRGNLEKDTANKPADASNAQALRQRILRHVAPHKPEIGVDDEDELATVSTAFAYTATAFAYLTLDTSSTKGKNSTTPSYCVKNGSTLWKAIPSVFLPGTGNTSDLEVII